MGRDMLGRWWVLARWWMTLPDRTVDLFSESRRMAVFHVSCTEYAVVTWALKIVLTRRDHTPGVEYTSFGIASATA